MRKERITLAWKDLAKNTGQLDWLPTNPRTWTADDVQRTESSIKEDPDFLEDRPILVVSDVPGNYIVFAGNLRCEAVSRIKMKSVPCVLYTPEGKEDELAIVRRAMKDNGSFGSWDFDALANEWGDLPLTDWGVPVWAATSVTDLADLGDEGDLTADQIAKPGESISGYTSISFLFPVDKAEAVNEYIKREGKETLAEKIIELCQEQEVK